jgi:hypothetical protein
MSTLTQEHVVGRARALYDDLEHFPSGVFCPWPLARVFNELLSQAKGHLGDDPVLSGITNVRRRKEDDALSMLHGGTTRALLGQMLTALQADR